MKRALAAATLLQVAAGMASAAPLLTATQTSPGVYTLQATTDAVFQAFDIGVAGNVVNGQNAASVHPLLGGRQLVSTTAGVRVLSPLGSPSTDGVFEPGVNLDIDLSYGVTTPTPGEWVDGLDAQPLLRFEVLGGIAVARMRLLSAGLVLEEFSLALEPGRAASDYDGSGVVDAADHAAWRSAFGQTVSPAGSGADGNADGIVDAGDYTYWRDAYTAALDGAAVPEPTGATLLGATLLGGYLALGLTSTLRSRKAVFSTNSSVIRIW